MFWLTEPSPGIALDYIYLYSIRLLVFRTLAGVYVMGYWLFTNKKACYPTILNIKTLE
jgi:hypothetical protein